MDTIVPIGRYYGIFGTMRHITFAEGSRLLPPPPATGKGKNGKAKLQLQTTTKGQGLDGLWRGWKVNWWGLVGLWSANAVGNGGEGEF